MSKQILNIIIVNIFALKPTQVPQLTNVTEQHLLAIIPFVKFISNLHTEKLKTYYNKVVVST